MDCFKLEKKMRRRKNKSEKKKKIENLLKLIAKYSHENLFICKASLNTCVIPGYK